MAAELSGNSMEALRSLALFLTDQRTVQEIADGAVHSISARVPDSLARVWLCRPSKTCPQCKRPQYCSSQFSCLRLESSSAETEADIRWQEVPLGDSIVGLTAIEGQEFHCNDRVNFSAEDYSTRWERNQFPVYCGFPLKSDGRLLGVLGIFLQAAPTATSNQNYATLSLLLSQALGSSLTRIEQQRNAKRLEETVETKTFELKARVIDLEETRLAMLNMMSEAFDSQRELRSLTEKLEIMVHERTRELIAAKEEAERANQLKSQFLGRVSHELRTPMHGVISFAKLGIRKIKKSDREKNHGYFQQILESADELLPLINDLLDISKIESGKVDYEFEAHDLHAFALDIIAKHEALLEENRLRFSFAMSDDFPKEVIYDRKHMRQVLNNLIGNAIKFSAPQSEIELRLEFDNEFVKVVVADRGPGIPEQEIASVFEDFSRCSSTENYVEGSGLGLAIAHAVALDHGGNIKVENRQSGGARFTLFWPHKILLAT